MKKVLSVLLALLCWYGESNAQKLTPQVDYWDYWNTQVAAKYTVLPDGVKHGSEYDYNKEGTMFESHVWDKGKRTSFVRYYINQKPEIKAKVARCYGLDVCYEYTSYNTDGSINTQYTMCKVPGNTTILHEFGYSVSRFGLNGLNIGEYTLKSYSNKEFSYQLSADFKKVELVDKSGYFTCTYDLVNELAKIKVYYGGDSYYKYDLTYKDGELSFKSTDEYDKFIANAGYLYNVTDVSFKCPDLSVPVKKDDFFKEFNTSCVVRSSTWYPYEYIHFESVYFIYDDHIIESIPFETLGLEPCGMLVKLSNATYYLELIEGNKADGVWEHKSTDGKKYVQLITKGGEFTNLTTKMTDDNGVVKEYSGGVSASKMSDPAQVKLTSQFGFDQCQSISLSVNGEGRYTEYGGPLCKKQVYVGKFESLDGENVLVAGEIKLYDLYQFNMKSLTYSMDSGKAHIEYNCGGTFNGKYPLSNLGVVEYMAEVGTNQSFEGVLVTADKGQFEGNFNVKVAASLPAVLACNVTGTAKFTIPNGAYEGGFLNGKAEGDGRFVDTDGNVFIGKFANGTLKPVDMKEVTYKFPTGESYVGQVSNGVFNGKGRLTLPNGDFYEGEFVNNTFSGTGVTRVTTKKGVYEGSVTNYVCDNPGPAKKIKAPASPVISFPPISVSCDIR